MRITALFLSLALIYLATTALHAQNPAAAQDAEAAREKLLKSADQLDNIQANSEATKNSVDGMKTDLAQLQASVTKLQSDNAALQQRVTDLQAALDASKAEQAKSRQTLIDNVADMIAAKNPGETKSTKKKKESAAESSPTPAANPALIGATTSSPGPVKTPPTKIAANLLPPPDADSVKTPEDNIVPPTPPPPKPQKGYYHVVASGETLRMIVDAYRENGVKTSVAAIRKANGLTDQSVLKTGQKLFIPKPGA